MKYWGSKSNEDRRLRKLTIKNIRNVRNTTIHTESPITTENSAGLHNNYGSVKGLVL